MTRIWARQGERFIQIGSSEYVTFKLIGFEDQGLNSGSHRGKFIPGRRDTLKGPEAGKGLDFMALKEIQHGWNLDNSLILELDQFRDGQ